MDCVYPYQYNVHDTTYYYYEPPLVEMVDSGMMMGVSPPMMSPATPPGHLQPLYMPDHNNNHTHTEYEYYGNCGETETEYQKLGYILDTEAAYIIVDPEFPFMDLPYLHTGKPGQPRKQKFSKKGFKGFKEYRDQEEEDEEESTVEFVQPEISYDRDQLMDIAKLPLSQAAPDSWGSIAKALPRLVRREGPTANLLIKEVRAIKRQEQRDTAKMQTVKKPASDTALEFQKCEEELQVLSL